MTNQEFIYELVKIIRQYEEGNAEGYFFRYDSQFFKDKGSTDEDDVRAMVLCSDAFAYAGADTEDVTPEDLPALRRAYEDAGECHWIGPILYTARKRNMRPLPAFFRHEGQSDSLFADLQPNPHERAS